MAKKWLAGNYRKLAIWTGALTISLGPIPAMAIGLTCERGLQPLAVAQQLESQLGGFRGDIQAFERVQEEFKVHQQIEKSLAEETAAKAREIDISQIQSQMNLMMKLTDTLSSLAEKAPSKPTDKMVDQAERIRALRENLELSRVNMQIEIREVQQRGEKLLTLQKESDTEIRDLDQVLSHLSSSENAEGLESRQRLIRKISQFREELNLQKTLLQAALHQADLRMTSLETMKLSIESYFKVQQGLVQQSTSIASLKIDQAFSPKELVDLSVRQKAVQIALEKAKIAKQQINSARGRLAAKVALAGVVIAGGWMGYQHFHQAEIQQEQQQKAAAQLKLDQKILADKALVARYVKSPEELGAARVAFALPLTSRYDFLATQLGPGKNVQLTKGQFIFMIEEIANGQKDDYSYSQRTDDVGIHLLQKINSSAHEDWGPSTVPCQIGLLHQILEKAPDLSSLSLDDKKWVFRQIDNVVNRYRSEWKPEYADEIQTLLDAMATEKVQMNSSTAGPVK